MCVQNPYSLTDRRPESERAAAACGEQGIAFVPFFSIVGTTRPGGPAASEPEPLISIARAHDASTAQIRLAWSLQQGAHVLVIPGTGNPEHVAENVAAGAIRLTAAELATLDAMRCDSKASR